MTGLGRAVREQAVRVLETDLVWEGDAFVPLTKVLNTGFLVLLEYTDTAGNAHSVYYRLTEYVTIKDPKEES